MFGVATAHKTSLRSFVRNTAFLKSPYLFRDALRGTQIPLDFSHGPPSKINVLAHARARTKGPQAEIVCIGWPRHAL